MSPEGASFHPDHQPRCAQRDSGTTGMNLIQVRFLNRESNTWSVDTSIAQFTSRHHDEVVMEIAKKEGLR